MLLQTPPTSNPALRGPNLIDKTSFLVAVCFANVSGCCFRHNALKHGNIAEHVWGSLGCPPLQSSKESTQHPDLTSASQTVTFRITLNWKWLDILDVRSKTELYYIFRNTDLRTAVVNCLVVLPTVFTARDFLNVGKCLGESSA